MNCAFCGKPVPSTDFERSGQDFLHRKCYRMAVVLTAAMRWYKAERDRREHHHARQDNGGDWQYVPEQLATSKEQAEVDLFEALRQLEG